MGEQSPRHNSHMIIERPRARPPSCLTDSEPTRRWGQWPTHSAIKIVARRFIKIIPNRHVTDLVFVSPLGHTALSKTRSLLRTVVNFVLRRETQFTTKTQAQLGTYGSECAKANGNRPTILWRPILIKAHEEDANTLKRSSTSMRTIRFPDGYLVQQPTRTSNRTIHL